MTVLVNNETIVNIDIMVNIIVNIKVMVTIFFFSKRQLSGNHNTSISFLPIKETKKKIIKIQSN